MTRLRTHNRRAKRARIRYVLRCIHFRRGLKRIKATVPEHYWTFVAAVWRTEGVRP